MLNQQMPGSLQLQVLASGHMPAGGDLVGQHMTSNLGTVYVFSAALDPSFKLMHTTSQAVSTISKQAV